jgi:ketosteroid isomerase-like protein
MSSAVTPEILAGTEGGTAQFAPHPVSAPATASPVPTGIGQSDKQEVSKMSESPALAIARAHIEAWSSKDYDKTRAMLAPDVHVTATSTFAAMQPTDLTGPDAYMQGLVAFADPIVPGSVRELGAVGDEHNALVLLDLEVAGGPFGQGVHAPCARLYQTDTGGQIKIEQIVFYVAGS